VIALDTNIVTEMMRGNCETLPEGVLYIPYVVQAEAYAGINAGGNPVKYKPVLDQLFSSSDVVLSQSLEGSTLEQYIDIYGFTRKNGTPVSPNDLWIAAECIALGLPLHTLDKDFDNIPQLAKV
jgi:predicted nucleic acid-binding protein